MIKISKITFSFFILIVSLYPQKINLTLNDYITKVREDHPQKQIDALDSEISKTIYEEEFFTLGFGGVFYSGYKQNHSDSPTITETKTINVGYDYKLIQTGTTFKVILNNGYSESSSVTPSFWRTKLSFTILQPLLARGLLYNFNQRVRDVKKFNYQISEVQYQLNLTGLIIAALNTYWQYGLNQEIYKLSKQLLRDSTELLKFNKKRLKIGTVSESDIISSETQIIKNQITLKNSEKNLKNIEDTLIYNMGYSTSYEKRKKIKLKIKDNFQIRALRIKSKEALNIALKERNELKIFSLNLQSAENAIALGKSSLWPALDAYLTYSFVGSDPTYGQSFKNAVKGFSLDNTDITLGLNFRLKTDILSYKLATKRPLQLYNKAKKSNINFIKNLENDIQAKVRNLNNTYSAYLKNKKIISLHKRKYKINRNDYLIGKIDFAILVQTENELKQAQIGYLSSKLNYWNAQISLENAQGLILKKYGLKKPTN